MTVAKKGRHGTRYLAWQLKVLGLQYVFANSGTGFPPIIEGLIEARDKGTNLPRAISVQHEHVTVAVAHGFYQASSDAQAVMLQTDVGPSTRAAGLVNTACDQVPMFVMSDRTPVTEQGLFDVRTVRVGWCPEIYDQAA